ncbi:MAG: hypothetical protein R3D25_12130 [Geminicoccaceae bacterium]
MAPMLAVDGLEKVYRKGWLDRTPTFRLAADFGSRRPRSSA